MLYMCNSIDKCVIFLLDLVFYLIIEFLNCIRLEKKVCVRGKLIFEEFFIEYCFNEILNGVRIYF